MRNCGLPITIGAYSIAGRPGAPGYQNSTLALMVPGTSRSASSAAAE